MNRLASMITFGLVLVLAAGLARAEPAPAFHAPSGYPPAFTPWALGVRTKVLRTLAARPYDKAASVVVAFKVHRDGRVTDVNVAGEPKVAAYVSAGMRRLARVAPFPASVPVGIAPLQVKVSFVDPPPRRRRRR